MLKKQIIEIIENTSLFVFTMTVAPSLLLAAIELFIKVWGL